ncbi:response regulator [Halohasta salina]|uniref:response regulator n=1 Tax=Halohasta salina TaxID=2961621 RepID=UPI0020A2FE8F|nr:response regulator [Halohasta salina]
MTALRVLLVEDSEFMSNRVSETLETTHEMRLTAVGTAAAARERLDADDYDCVVTNYELPDETGIELAASLNASGTDPVVPVILLTGKKLEPIARGAIRKGVTEFVYKGDHAAGEMDVLENRIRLTVRAYGDRERVA